jgi:hypothetical protein
MQCSPQRTHKRPSSEPHGATTQQAIAKTPYKWSAYQIPVVTVVFVVLVCKPHSQKLQEALNLLVTEERYRALFYMPLYTFYTILQCLFNNSVYEQMDTSGDASNLYSGGARFELRSGHRSSETSLHIWTTWRYILNDGNIVITAVRTSNPATPQIRQRPLQLTCLQIHYQTIITQYTVRLTDSVVK